MLHTASKYAVKLTAVFAIMFAAVGIVAVTSTPALAAKATIADITTSSVTLATGFDAEVDGTVDAEESTVFTYPEDKEYKNAEYTVLEDGQVVVGNLQAGRSYSIDLVTDKHKYSSALVKTVANAPTRFKIDYQVTRDKVLCFAFKTGACDGWKITFDPYSADVSTKTVTKKVSHKDEPFSVQTPEYTMSLKTAYKATTVTWVEDSNGKKHYSAPNTTVVLPQPKATAKLVNKRSIKKGVRVSWNKVAGATSYTLYTSTKNGSYKKVCTTKSTSKVIKSVKGSSIKKGKYYYMYVTANRGDATSGKLITYYRYKIK